MPSTRIRSAGGTFSVATYDAVGRDGVFPFIQHIGLAVGSGVQSRDRVAVIDMGPPLRSDASMSASVVGQATLSADEQQKIRTFIDRHEREHQPTRAVRLNRDTIGQIYCILPHATPFQEADGRYARMRFSCTGFVIEAYKYARIQLINEDQIPAVDLTMIQQAYPTFATLLNNQQLRASLGLMGSGPWPVALCGYLFHALNRTPQAIRQVPYVVQPGNENFS